MTMNIAKPYNRNSLNQIKSDVFWRIFVIKIISPARNIPYPYVT